MKLPIHLAWGVSIFIALQWVGMVNCPVKGPAQTTQLHIGLYARSITEPAGRKDSETTLNFLLKELLAAAKKQHRFNITDIKAILFDDIDGMRAALLLGDLDMIVAPPFLISKYFKRDELTMGFAGVLHNGQPDSILLIARADKGIASVENLSGKKILLLEDDELTEVFIDYLCLKQFKKSYKAILSAVERQQKASHIILDIYFNKADAGVVFRGAYELMAGLNPDVAKKVMVIESYPSKSRNVSFFRKDYPYAKEILVLAQTSFKEDARTKQILEIFRTSGLYPFNVEELGQFDEFYVDYQKLRHQAGLLPLTRK